ncbi:helix-turn-helix transcriptional regulator [uncultured Acidaminococcus sp.]|uniref:helix-turn-helix domain-containing protein n=1 Tax=uncultured Acidaminococcus sp. TaxID=352152 RepID=UPI002942851F|nr:helix-turn-helix transcriptional regulator [uncultured Acidaminococcus sp.]
MNFQQRLRHYREKAGYKSAKEFAEKLGIGYTTYVAYENKDREPRYKTLCQIAHLLNITPNDLLGFEENDELHRYIAICNSSENKAEIKFYHDKPYIKLDLKDEDSVTVDSLACTIDEFSQIMEKALSSPYYEKTKNDIKIILSLAIHKSALEHIISTHKHSFTDKNLSTIKSLLNKLP